MRTETVTLEGSTPGSIFTVTALNFGPEGGKKVYMQGSLHADELPGSLMIYYLHQELLALEAKGCLKAQIVVVPLCNPLGLTQMLYYTHIGRFNLLNGQNYNRLVTIPLYSKLKQLIETQRPQWSERASANTIIIRRLLRQVLNDMQPCGLLDSLHLNLLKWSYDAELVLDLHCDCESVVHLYTLPRSWGIFEPLARYLGSQCQILSDDSNTSSFDEIVSTIWPRLQEEYPQVIFEQGCHSATVEFRGENDLTHELAAQDAQGVLQYLNLQGYLKLPAEDVRSMPPLLSPPNPLEGLCYVTTHVSGIVVYLVRVGDWVEENQDIIDIMDPFTLQKTTIKSPARGIVFAHSAQRVARAGRNLMSISSPDKQGNAGLSP